jgi:hypothetical protein
VQGTGELPVGLVGRDEGGDGDLGRLGEEERNLESRVWEGRAADGQAKEGLVSEAAQCCERPQSCLSTPWQRMTTDLADAADVLLAVFGPEAEVLKRMSVAEGRTG